MKGDRMFYKTITESVKTELIIKKSRFIGMLIPLSCAREAEKILSDIRQEYPGANHYCYAWVIRQEGSRSERSSDDGEPSGTAGWPILNVLQKVELENVMAVVVRYFGGTLLGTGGLVRAYTQSVQAALDQARIVKMVYCQMIMVTLDYSYYGSFENQFSHLLKQITDLQFTDRVNIKIWIPVDQVDGFAARIKDFTQGNADVEYGQQDFVALK